VQRQNACDINHIMKRIRKLLPEYAIPKKILLLNQLPKNSNDKVDSSKLVEILRSDSNIDEK